VRIEKSNILLIGPSGSGKTHLVKSLASYLNVPLVIGDATSLTEAGYVGDDVESLLSRLILAANGDLGAAQQGIVFIDEIDKIKGGGSGYKDLRQGVQHALLKLLEGTVAVVPPQGGYKHPAQPGIPFDTTNVLFICGGAFVGLGEIIAKRLGRGGFGFGQMNENSQVNGLLSQVKPEDLESFGLIPELIGRLQVIAPLDALGVDDLARILQSTKGSLIQQFRKLVKFHGADLIFTGDAIKEIARVALQRGTGARGLRSVVEQVMEPVLFDVEAGVRYVITPGTVRGGEAVKRRMEQMKAPLGKHLLRRFATGRNAQSLGLNQQLGAKAALVDPSPSMRCARRGVRVRRPTRPAGLGFHSSEQPRSPGTGRRPGLGCTLRERKSSRIPAEQDAHPVAKCWRGGSRCCCYGSPGRSCYGSPSGRSPVDC
jgi:ATP-dependent Clp protease ATP-binding subunit ClpX